MNDDEKCERREDTPGEWTCHRCMALWFGELAKTDFRPSECRSRAVPSQQQNNEAI